MKRWFAFVLALVVAFSATPATAATPADTLVMAWQFDDIITLDPAEIFEFSEFLLSSFVPGESSNGIRCPPMLVAVNEPIE